MAGEHLNNPIPTQEREQPDPMLQLTTGRMGAGGLTLVALIIAVIVGVVFWGLNSSPPVAQTATMPATAHGANGAGGKG